MKTKNIICIDLRWIDCSGIGTYIKGLMPGLISALPDVRIVGLGPENRLREFQWSGAPNVKLINCNAARYSLAEQMLLPVAIPRDTTLFFSPHYPIPLLYTGRVVVTVHDLSHLVVPEIAGSLLKRTYARTLLNAVRRRAELILTVSDFSRSELLRCTRGERTDNVLTVHEGISEEWYGAGMAPYRQERPYMAYVGNVKPYKNVSRLVEAFLRLLDTIPHDLLVIGQNEGFITGESAAFFERAKSAGSRLRFTGHVPQEQLRAMVAGADALIMPSLYEGFGFPPLEAMAAGVPALASNAASLPEVCGDAALYCDPHSVEDIAKQIVSILTDQSLRRRLKDAGKKRAQMYSWDVCAGRTASAIRSVL